MLVQLQWKILFRDYELYKIVWVINGSNLTKHLSLHLRLSIFRAMKVEVAADCALFRTLVEG